MKWDSGKIKVRVRTPSTPAGQADTFEETSLSFLEWYQRLDNRFTAYLAALETLDAAKANMTTFDNAVVPLTNPMRAGSDMERYMREIENLKARRAAQKALVDQETEHVTTLKQELFWLGNMRDYESSAQASYLLDVDGQPWLLSIFADGSVTAQIYVDGMPTPNL